MNGFTRLSMLCELVVLAGRALGDKLIGLRVILLSMYFSSGCTFSRAVGDNSWGVALNTKFEIINPT